MTEELREHSASTNTIHHAQPEASPESVDSMEACDFQALDARLGERLGINKKALHLCEAAHQRTDTAAQAILGANTPVPNELHLDLLFALTTEVEFLRDLSRMVYLHACGDLLPQEIRSELLRARDKFSRNGLLA